MGERVLCLRALTHQPCEFGPNLSCRTCTTRHQVKNRFVSLCDAGVVNRKRGSNSSRRPSSLDDDDDSSCSMEGDDEFDEEGGDDGGEGDADYRLQYRSSEREGRSRDSHGDAPTGTESGSAGIALGDGGGSGNARGGRWGSPAAGSPRLGSGITRSAGSNAGGRCPGITTAHHAEVACRDDSCVGMHSHVYAASMLYSHRAAGMPRFEAHRRPGLALSHHTTAGCPPTHPGDEFGSVQQLAHSASFSGSGSFGTPPLPAVPSWQQLAGGFAGQEARSRGVSRMGAEAAASAAAAAAAVAAIAQQQQQHAAVQQHSDAFAVDFMQLLGSLAGAEGGGETGASTSEDQQLQQLVAGQLTNLLPLDVRQASGPAQSIEALVDETLLQQLASILMGLPAAPPVTGPPAGIAPLAVPGSGAAPQPPAAASVRGAAGLAPGLGPAANEAQMGREELRILLELLASNDGGGGAAGVAPMVAE